MGRKAKIEFVCGAFFLLLGCSVYLLFRSKTIRLYQWSKSLGWDSTVDAARNCVQGWQLPEFVRFSLPDGLFCIAYILIADAIWKQDRRRGLRLAFVALMPMIAIGHELCQWAGLSKGTFDIADLACYALPLAVYLLRQMKA